MKEVSLSVLIRRLLIPMVPLVVVAGCAKGTSENLQSLTLESLHGYSGSICKIVVDDTGYVSSEFNNHYRGTTEKYKTRITGDEYRKILLLVRNVRQFNQNCASGDGNDIDIHMTLRNGRNEEINAYCKGATDWPGDSDVRPLIDVIKGFLPDSYKEACIEF